MALATLAALRTALGISPTDVSQDVRLQQFLDAADAAVKEYCGRDFESTSYPGAASRGRGDSGYYDGTGRPELLLRQTPVTAVSAVYLDAGGYYGQASGAFAASTLLTAGVDYIIQYDGSLGGASASHSGILLRMGGFGGNPGLGWGDAEAVTGSLVRPFTGPVWPRGRGNIKVAYTAGYSSTTVPADLSAAVIELATRIHVTAENGGYPVASETLGEYSVSFAQGLGEGRPELATVRQLLSRYRRLSGF